MAAGIVFIVYVQRKAVATSLQTLLFEGAKSTLATGLWLWLILDSAYGPSRMHDDPEVVRRKVQRDAFASIVLLVVFYPPLGYAWVVAKSKRNHDDVGRANDGGEEAAEPTERAPLLSQEGGRTLGR
ncbi:hypothetical protein BDW02DRAFT_572657 [Decorospora gaudefroyi]|uniref:Uncharacterized protein n=1 Tax=Decorospora gaudefroyi TaxID=184978 RepID=A0A6A5K215_9PLEO|nr:hypothetical protein BDW02DRAFT_572657 [Decorospora gaudefroyi]